MSKTVIAIHDWVDLHRLCMASRSKITMHKLDLAIDALASAKIENEDRCFSIFADYLREARNHIDEVLKELADSESFALSEVRNRFTPPEVTETE